MSRRPAIVTLILSLTLAAGVPGQTPRQVYTNPDVPSRDALNRLNLDMAWKAVIPVSGAGDGISLVQWLDGQVFVQTHSSRLVALDARTGEPMWQFAPERPYTNIYPVGVNARSVFLLNGNKLYSLNRGSGLKIWEYNLNTAPSQGPLVEPGRVFVIVGGNRIFNLALPDPAPVLGVPDAAVGQVVDRPTTPEGASYQAERVDRAPPSVIPSVQLQAQDPGTFLGTNRSPSITFLPTLRPPYRMDNGGRSESISVLRTLRPPYRLPDGNHSPSIVALPPSVARAMELNTLRPQLLEPTKTWEYLTPGRVAFDILATRNRLFVPTVAHYSFTLDKLRKRLLEQYDTRSEVAAQPAIAIAKVYVPDHAGNLTSFDLRGGGRREWRYSGGGALNVGPVVADDKVFVGGTLAGLSAVDRQTGVGVWKNENAVRFHAAGPKFVYATDRLGRLLLLERSRGLELTSWDGAMPFNVPIVNDQNDRLLLGANNGLLLCLRDKAHADPVPLYTPTEEELAQDDAPDPAEEVLGGPPAADPTGGGLPPLPGGR